MWAAFGVVLASAVLLLGVLGWRGIREERRFALYRARSQSERAVEIAASEFQRGINSRRATAPVWHWYSPAPLPSPTTEIVSRYDAAVNGPPSEAVPELRQISTSSNVSDAMTSAGLPLAPLVEWALVERASASELDEAMERLGRLAVESHPSVITPEILQRAGVLLRQRGVAPTVLDRWRERWDGDELVRTAILKGANGGGPSPVRGWVDAAGTRYWVEPVGPAWQSISRQQVYGLFENALRSAAAALPSYAALNMEWQGEPFGLAGEQGAELLAQRQATDLVVKAMLVEPRSLFVQQRRQTVWLASLLSVALAAVVGGVWVLQRSLRRELQLNELKSDFVSSVSHELRAPIASMRLMAENLESGTVFGDERRRDYHRLIAEECRRLSVLIENILDFARIERNRKTYHFAEADIGALIQDAMNLLRPRAQQRRQKINLEITSPEPPPSVDSLSLQQAVINLLDNAIKFSSAESEITVRVSHREKGWWEISVADHGPGIPISEQARIFERFHRIGSELVRETQGAGIGLTLVKHIAEGHGGRVEVESRPGHGACFRLILPHRIEAGSDVIP